MLNDYARRGRSQQPKKNPKRKKYWLFAVVLIVIFVILVHHTSKVERVKPHVTAPQSTKAPVAKPAGQSVDFSFQKTTDTKPAT